MAKKVYHIPLQQTLQFIKKNKAELNNLTTDKKLLEYSKLLGKSHYHLEIERFIHFFKIEKDITHSLNTIEYFNSAKFIDEIFNLLTFSQFDLDKSEINYKDFFYGVCYIFSKNNSKLFELFMQKIFLHFHTTFNPNSNIKIDYKDMSITLIKSKKYTLKESFGEDKNGSYFKILLDEKIVIDERGKLIKTLRKKVYKKLFYYLIDLDDEIILAKEEAYERVQSLKDM